MTKPETDKEQAVRELKESLADIRSGSGRQPYDWEVTRFLDLDNLHNIHSGITPKDLDETPATLRCVVAMHFKNKVRKAIEYLEKVLKGSRTHLITEHHEQCVHEALALKLFTLEDVGSSEEGFKELLRQNAKLDVLSNLKLLSEKLTKHGLTWADVSMTGPTTAELSLLAYPSIDKDKKGA